MSTQNDNHCRRDELAFLPAALEIQETPPHPLAHWLGRSLMLFCAIALLWACVGKVSIIATAEGKIIPSSRIKLIQPAAKGVIKDIRVREGSHVSEGQPLVELDRAITEADKQRLLGEWQQVKSDTERLTEFARRLANDSVSAPPRASKITRESAENSVRDELQQRLLEQQWQQFLAQRAAAEGELARRQAEKQANEEEISKLKGTLPLITKRTEAVKMLMQKQLVSENEYLQLEEQRISQQQDLAAHVADEAQEAAAVAQAKQQRIALVAQAQTDALAQLATARQKADSLREEYNKATDVNARQVLYAPVSGQVQGLAINTIGGVVTEAQQLMTIVPEGENLEVEAYLQNQDIGFVHAHDLAEIKVHTFPFTRYGVINAKVMRISNDAFAIHEADKAASTQGEARSAINDQSLVYTLGLVMEKNSIRVNGEEVMLMPGMAVTAEVKTGERRIIEYFLSPLVKATQESIRER